MIKQIQSIFRALAAFGGTQKEPTLMEKVNNIAEKTKDSFFVMDNSNRYWGHNIEFWFQKEIEGCQVHTVAGFRDLRRVNDGDHFTNRLKNGKTGLFFLYDVERKSDPRDMFVAQAVCVDDDYKGGYGLRGESAAEPNARHEIIESFAKIGVQVT